MAFFDRFARRFPAMVNGIKKSFLPFSVCFSGVASFYTVRGADSVATALKVFDTDRHKLRRFASGVTSLDEMIG